MNVALPEVVAAAVDEDVDGAVTDGVLGDVGVVVEGDVDCAIALVNARPLTAATAMIRLSMYASCGAISRRFRGSPGAPASCQGNAGTAAVFPFCDTFAECDSPGAGGAIALQRFRFVPSATLAA